MRATLTIRMGPPRCTLVNKSPPMFAVLYIPTHPRQSQLPQPGAGWALFFFSASIALFSPFQAVVSIGGERRSEAAYRPCTVSARCPTQGNSWVIRHPRSVRFIFLPSPHQAHKSFENLYIENKWCARDLGLAKPSLMTGHTAILGAHSIAFLVG